MLVVVVVALALLPSQNAPSHDFRCGSRGLFVGLAALGLTPGSLDEIEAFLGPPPERGYSYADLEKAARQFGAKTLVVETSAENLRSRATPFVAMTLINENHYVLLYGIDDKFASIINGNRKLSTNLDTFLSIWNRKALLLSDADLESEEAITSRRRWRSGALYAIPVMLALIVLAFWGFRVTRKKARAALVPLLFAGFGSDLVDARSARAGDVRGSGKIEGDVKPIDDNFTGVGNDPRSANMLRNKM